jgi:hypothetical protein
VFVEDLGVGLRGTLTCSNTIHSDILNSALRPLHCSRHSVASLEPLPAAHPACRSQPTWGRSQESLTGPGTEAPLPLHPIHPFYQLNLSA